MPAWQCTSRWRTFSGSRERILAEFQHLSDVLRLRRKEAGGFLNDIVEFQLKPGVLAIAAKSLRFGLLRIEDRENVADLAIGVPGKLFQPANGDREGSVGWQHVSSSLLRFRAYPLLMESKADRL